MGVTQQLHDLNLAENLLQVVLVQLRLVDDFNGDLESQSANRGIECPGEFVQHGHLLHEQEGCAKKRARHLVVDRNFKNPLFPTGWSQNDHVLSRSVLTIFETKTLGVGMR